MEGTARSYENEEAARYRAYAKELRTIAESDRLEQTRNMLIRVALEYERRANKMDELVHSRPSNGAANS